jgi:hypothetical protein
MWQRRGRILGCVRRKGVSPAVRRMSHIGRMYRMGRSTRDERRVTMRRGFV